MRVGASFLSVSGDGLIGDEVGVAFDWEAEFAADGRKFGKRHVTKFRAAKAKIAETEGETVAGIQFRQEPRALGVGREEFDDGLEVERGLIVVDSGRVARGHWQGVVR
jgi:hypothetical protein